MPSKATLRRAALSKRKLLSEKELREASARLGGHLFAQFAVADWRWLHIFLPLASKNEPDTWPIIRRIWAEQPALHLAAPVVQPDGVSLKNYALTSATPLLANRWGILEPAPDPATEVRPAQLDAVLVPLLACDQHGQRVGYGGGFYDRLLAQCRPDTLFIGLNILDEQPVPALADVLPTDVPLHALITPGGVWNF